MRQSVQKNETNMGKKWSEMFQEPAQIILDPYRVKHVMKSVQISWCKIPLYQCAVNAGFPSPAEDEMEKSLDLNELLIKRPASTFFLRVSGSSMIKAGIQDKDILIVDRSIEPVHGKIVIAAVNGELTVKRLHLEGKKIFLMAENDNYPRISIGEGTELHIWGVVTSVIHSL